MKYLSYGVMVYMLLALIWWTILLSKNNTKLYEKNKEINYLTNNINKTVEAEKIYKDFLRNKYMILGEGMVFGISLILGLWFIQQAYTREVKYTTNQKNFLLSITHELKSPIAAIHLITETLIKRKLPNEKILDLQQSILSETSRLEKLINNLLLATKIESGYQYQLEVCNLNEMLEISSKRIQLQNPNLKISSNFTKQPLFVNADKESIYSVINNILENSVKYSNSNPEIQISLYTQKEFAVINFADNGIGIPDVEKSKVLEQFYRVGNEETRSTKGTGLGLFIVKKIIDAHNGKFTISDNNPVGTLISVFIPFK